MARLTSLLVPYKLLFQYPIVVNPSNRSEDDTFFNQMAGIILSYFGSMNVQPLNDHAVSQLTTFVNNVS